MCLLRLYFGDVKGERPLLRASFKKMALNSYIQNIKID